MKSILTIAINTFREVIRDRILISILVFAVLLILLSLALGQLSFSEQARLSANFGLTGIHISVVVLSIFIGSTLVYKEIEKQTILTLLARPINRPMFMVGKFLGLTFINVVVMAGLAIVLAALLNYLDLSLNLTYGLALFGILIEGLLLTSIAVFFGSFAKPVSTVIFSAAIFLIGHWVSSLEFFIKKSDSESFKLVATWIQRIIPDLERFNWRSAPIYNLAISGNEVFYSFVYGFCWITGIILLSCVVFEKRDFV